MLEPARGGTPPLHRCALALAHPGHELRLTKWVSQAKPVTHLLTRGSRSGSASDRPQASHAVLRALGAEAGDIFGGELDRDVYGWMMAGDARPFVRLADELAASFVRQQVRTVVMDSWQLYNAVHDLWHLTARAACAIAEGRTGQPIERLDYEVVPAAMSARSGGDARLCIALDPGELARKIRLAEDFPEIAGDVTEVIAAGGMSFLAVERLNRLRPIRELLPRRDEKPAYEVFGEQRVAAGLYAEVLRWSHIQPIAEALCELAEASEALA
jgi:hypothetical protein